MEAAELRTVIVEGETVDTVVPEDNTDTENYSPSLGRIYFLKSLHYLVEKDKQLRYLPV